MDLSYKNKLVEKKSSDHLFLLKLFVVLFFGWLVLAFIFVPPIVFSSMAWEVLVTSISLLGLIILLLLFLSGLWLVLSLVLISVGLAFCLSLFPLLWPMIMPLVMVGLVIYFSYHKQ